MARRHRSFADRMGIYRRDGQIKAGRAPYLTEDDWRAVENPTRLKHVLQRLGLVYAPDHTRPRLRLRGGRTTD